MRTKIECGQCKRLFIEPWEYDHHICDQNLGVVDRIRERWRFSRLEMVDKVLSYVKRVDPESAVLLENARDAINRNCEL